MKSYFSNGATQKVLLTTGCFDLFHAGHVHYLSRIDKAYPTHHKVVAIASDACVRRLKGEGRPICSQDERQIMLEACRFVDEVIVFQVFLSEDDVNESGHAQLIDRVKPDVFVRGPRAQIDLYHQYLKPYNIPLEIVDAVDFTTTDLLARIRRSN